jgi:hypothetical protein
MKIDTVLTTDGHGYWSRAQKQVRCTRLSVPYIDADTNDFGELRVYFDTTTWDVDQDGLIYTDKKFMRELRDFLNTMGLDGSDVDYSEQGMQGDDYVSCDVRGKFLATWPE